jgi:putative ABC transport system permease protein
VRTRLHVVDEDFVDVYGLQVIAGHNLADSAADRGQGLLINETLAARLGWSPQDAVGQALRWNDRREATVVGVLRDFHNRSLHEPIGPVALSYDESRFLRLGVRLGPGRLAESLGHLEEVWHRFQPDRPFGVSFLDDDLASLYRREQRLGEVTAVFSTLAVIVATLGLVGLVSFLAERKTREHGIRKVLGASVADVVTGLSREFAILVLLSNLIAWPVAWWLMSTWLGGFAYRVTLGPGVFVGAGAIGLAIAIGSVAYRAYTAATANPVDALRCE